MKVIIIEDEVAACDNLRKIIKQIDPEIEILGCFDTVTESVLWLGNHLMPDLIFMDIQLADGSSFSIFECVNVESPVIFTTAYDEFAIDAFKVNSIDYILKPVTLENTRKAIEKYNHLNNLSLQKIISQMHSLLKPKDFAVRILVPLKDKIISVKTENIAFFYNTEGMTEVTALDKTKYRIDKSLDAIMDKLDPAQFIRANRQYILSKNALKDITIWFDSRLLINLIIDTPEKIFISKNRAAEFKNWYAL